ncbi:unnamed protein product [Schistosoma bovis]|nr:unnamed protein product [Schistosoma bovis]
MGSNGDRFHVAFCNNFPSCSECKLKQKRLTTIESQLTLLNSLPNNEDIIGYIDNDLHNKKNNNSLDNSNDNYRKVIKLWQTVQTNKR